MMSKAIGGVKYTRPHLAISSVIDGTNHDINQSINWIGSGGAILETLILEMSDG